MDNMEHSGIKGMKWGRRRFENYDGTLTPAGKERYADDRVSKKQQKLEAKATKKYAKAGKYKGYAEDSRRLGDKAAEKYMKDADVYDRQAKAWEKKGHVLAAEIARRRARSLKDKGADARKEHDDDADFYDRLASRMEQRADKYASKKRVDFGKQKANSIMKKMQNETVSKLERDRERAAEFEKWLNESD